MTKLYYRFGCMESSETLQLLTVAHNHEVSQGKITLTFKPKADDRTERIETRAGLYREVDLILDECDNNIMRYVGKE